MGCWAVIYQLGTMTTRRTRVTSVFGCWALPVCGFLSVFDDSIMATFPPLLYFPLGGGVIPVGEIMKLIQLLGK